MRENRFERFHDVVLELIDLNMQNRNSEIANSAYQAMSILQYIHEYQSVKLDIGRCVGKSTIISEMGTDEDILIVTRREFLKQFENFKGDVFTIHEALRNVLGSSKIYKNIYFDEISYGRCNTTKLDELLIVLWKNRFQNFVYLGAS